MHVTPKYHHLLYLLHRDCDCTDRRHVGHDPIL